MSVNGLNTPLTALQTNQLRMDVTANNVANVNTDGFRPSTVNTADRAYINDIGTGTQATGTTTYGPPPRTGVAAAPRQTPGPAPVDAGTNTAAPSSTDMVNEMANMLNSRNAYTLNANVSRTQQDVTQTLMDLKA